MKVKEIELEKERERIDKEMKAVADEASDKNRSRSGRTSAAVDQWLQREVRSMKLRLKELE